MTMNVTHNYSQFYKGSEPLKSYGSGGEGLMVPKDTLVKYEFNTTDEHGNKIMAPLSREEALRVMKEVSGQYGDNVLISFSGDGLQALARDLQDQIQKGDWKLSEQRKADQARKQELMEQSIVHLENTHRLIIPNIQTNARLYDSLESAPEEVVKAANGIIKNYLMPHDVSGMTEEQRRDAIAFGLEEARYLARNYLDEQQGADFLSAMETIARYGMNGTVSENGRVTYRIERGPVLGAPEDYVSQSDILKDKAPDLYRELQDLNRGIGQGETGWGRRFIELHQRIERRLNGYSGTEYQGKRLTFYEEAAYEYRSWKKAMDETALPNAYSDVDYRDMNCFFGSLKFQGSLGESWMAEARQRFAKWLEGL